MALAPGFHRVDLKSKLGATPSSSAAIGVNNHGVVVGKYTLNGTNYGFVWDTAMPMTDGLVVGIGDKTSLAALSPNDAYVGVGLNDINDKGLIVGRIDFGMKAELSSKAIQLFRPQAVEGAPKENFEVLPEPPAGGMPTVRNQIFGGTSFHAHGVNNHDQIVGIFKDQNSKTLGFSFTNSPLAAPGTWNGPVTYVDTGNQFTQLFGINDAGTMVGASGDVDSTTLVPETLWMPSTGGTRRISILRPNLVPRQYGTAHRVNNYGFIVGETALNGFPISKVPAAWGILRLPWKAQLPDPTLATVLSVNGTPCAETAFYGLNDHMWLVGECLEDTLGATNEAFVLVPEAEPRVHGSPSEWLGQLWRAFGASKR